MANFMYPNAKYRMLTGQFDWVNEDISVVLLATGQYTPSINHASLLDIPASARVATSDFLVGKTVSVNVVDADDYLFTYVAGPEVNGVVLVSMGVNEANSWLICFMDSAITGIPFSPSASPAQLVWNNGPNKIFAL